MTSNFSSKNISIINNYPSNTTIINEDIQQFDTAHSAASSNTL
jgi:hypothetical protein